jgi:hypothetical protein
MKKEIQEYNEALSESDREICDALASEIDRALPKAENKICTRIRYGFWMITPSSATASKSQGYGSCFGAGPILKKADCQFRVESLGTLPSSISPSPK